MRRALPMMARGMRVANGRESASGALRLFDKRHASLLLTPFMPPTAYGPPRCAAADIIMMMLIETILFLLFERYYAHAAPAIQRARVTHFTRAALTLCHYAIIYYFHAIDARHKHYSYDIR